MIKNRNKPETVTVSTKISEEFIKNTWVHDGREWRLTTRVAIQISRTGKQKVLWEIQPLAVYASNPDNRQYNRWLQPNVLFMVVKEDEAPLIPPSDETDEDDNPND